MIRLFFALPELINHLIDHQAQVVEVVFELGTTSIRQVQQVVR
tara:strand:+ start:500 stop:628 length:129 start_codon:yes stop_codon:yes gene_type:complete